MFYKRQIHQDEKVLAIYRKHRVTLTPQILQYLILLLIPWYLGMKYEFILSETWHTSLFLAWTILIGVLLIRALLLYLKNVYIVTNKRLLHIEHNGLMKKYVIETPLDRILNVSYRTTGLTSTLSHYGDVLVQVVGLEEPLVLKHIPNPAKVKDFIWKMHQEFAGEQKLTYTKPEIVAVDRELPYAPHGEKHDEEI